MPLPSRGKLVPPTSPVGAATPSKNTTANALAVPPQSGGIAAPLWSIACVNAPIFIVVSPFGPYRPWNHPRPSLHHVRLTNSIAQFTWEKQVRCFMGRACSGVPPVSRPAPRAAPWTRGGGSFGDKRRQPFGAEKPAGTVPGGRAGWPSKTCQWHVFETAKNYTVGSLPPAGGGQGMTAGAPSAPLEFQAVLCYT